MTVIDSFTGDYKFLSNFQPGEVFLDRLPYPSVEHAYQAAKTVNSEEREPIRLLFGYQAGLAKRMGRKLTVRPDWDKVKFDIMTDLVHQKFNLHPMLRDKLLATGDATLIEGNHWNDTVWGVCNGVGTNWLGQILMHVRAELRKGNS